jgi:hypothetical protein
MIVHVLRFFMLDPMGGILKEDQLSVLAEINAGLCHF